MNRLTFLMLMASLAACPEGREVWAGELDRSEFTPLEIEVLAVQEHDSQRVADTGPAGGEDMIETAGEVVFVVVVVAGLVALSVFGISSLGD
ncbi:MAG: hypothetical protein HYU36_17740 [Planctomycetes bacterium]|nr:hypothetical protein [Planctomycetota bacterium]